MKKTILTSMLFLMSLQPMVAQEKPCAKCSEAKQLVERLVNIQKKHPGAIMFGHQDDPMYGIDWEWDRNRSDVLELSGDYPAIMGFELGGIEMGDEKSLDSVPFTRITEEVQAHHIRGGIVTISWHPRNPLTGGTAWDVSSSEVVKSILPGGSRHAEFQVWMQRMADFLETLRTGDGKRIPIIFRPWHENHGSWFWWGKKLCTPTEYKALWNMLQDYLTAQGLTNLVWTYSYSPSITGGEEDYMERYPSNDRVAIVGTDVYQGGGEEAFVRGMEFELGFLKKFAKKNDKLFALTECGFNNIPDSTWWTRVLLRECKKHPDVLYALPWRNTSRVYFTPDKNQPSALDFRKFTDNKDVLMLKDIRN